MVQTSVDRQDSAGESINHKLDYMIGNREHGQLVQIDRANSPIPTAQKTVSIGPVQIAGVGTAALYTTGDAFGTTTKILVPKSGIIQGIRFYDLDNEGVNMEAYFFRQAPAGLAADNAAVSVPDDQLHLIEASILIDTWRTFAAAQLGVEDNLGISYTAPSGALWVHWVTRGGPTIAAGSIPLFKLLILSDE